MRTVKSPPEIKQLVFGCIDRLNQQLPVGGKLVKSEDSVLIGEGGVLDSLGLITLCVNIEQTLSDQLGIQCAVLDELMIERVEHPMHKVGTMVQWIAQQANVAA
jgi:hypothetical protein